ncbi:MAG: hypothetical protein J5I93_15615, partial [Pirellulaceae bacterium]|nr:hypothetical protein [Pirellulaceae bacterium]
KPELQRIRVPSSPCCALNNWLTALTPQAPPQPSPKRGGGQRDLKGGVLAQAEAVQIASVVMPNSLGKSAFFWLHDLREEWHGGLEASHDRHWRIETFSRKSKDCKLQIANCKLQIDN